MKTWQSRYPQEREPIEDARVAPEMNSETLGINERSIGSLTRPATGQNTGVKPDHHDFRDYGQHELKRDPGREWERSQQPEKIPGVG